MVKKKVPPLKKTSSVKRPKRPKVLSSGFGRTCPTCKKHFGTLNRFKVHITQCKVIKCKKVISC